MWGKSAHANKIVLKGDIIICYQGVFMELNIWKEGKMLYAKKKKMSHQNQWQAEGRNVEQLEQALEAGTLALNSSPYHSPALWIWASSLSYLSLHFFQPVEW